MEIDWHTFFFSDQPYGFFFEIMIRTTIMFLGVVAVLRMTGKRGVQQLSIFEMVMIITMGSAAGDAMFYGDVGILHALTVFVVILCLYRVVIWLITKSDKAEILLEGEPIYLLKHGVICVRDIGSEDMGADEFFGELRSKGIEHLGQLRYVILEDSGVLSVFYYKDADVKPGLPILPHEYHEKGVQIREDGLYACARCGNTENLSVAPGPFPCGLCGNREWVAAIDRRRIV